MIAILDHALTRAIYVDTSYQGIQWLEDSIVFVERELSRQTVVRYFPGHDRREDLLSIPTPPVDSEP